MRGAQPCDFCTSLVSSQIFVFTQPTTPPEPDQIVLSASCAKFRWNVPKQVSTSSNFFVLGSKTVYCRPLLLIGNSLAEGCVEPSLQKSGFAAGGRIRDVLHIRPFWSIVLLCVMLRLLQYSSSPQ